MSVACLINHIQFFPGNVMLLIVWTATYDFCPTVPVDSSCPILDRLNYIQIVICGEAALLLVVHSIYIGKQSYYKLLIRLFDQVALYLLYSVTFVVFKCCEYICFLLHV